MYSTQSQDKITEDSNYLDGTEANQNLTHQNSFQYIFLL
jgi:hypothetical protein